MTNSYYRKSILKISHTKPGVEKKWKRKSNRKARKLLKMKLKKLSIPDIEKIDLYFINKNLESVRTSPSDGKMYHRNLEEKYRRK